MLMTGLIGACSNSAERATETSTSSVATTETSTEMAAPPMTSTVAPVVPAVPDSADVLEAAYLDDDVIDQAFWQRAVELLNEQDSAVLTPTGDVNIAITREGETVTVYEDDLGSIAYNSCYERATGGDAAETVGWIKDAFEVQRRWEAGQLRLAAIETKCPSLSN